MEAVQTGLRGVVTEAGSGAAVASANIQVAGIDKNVTTSLRGEYWRLLAPGKYWSANRKTLLDLYLL